MLPQRGQTRQTVTRGPRRAPARLRDCDEQTTATLIRQNPSGGIHAARRPLTLLRHNIKPLTLAE
jgi:hypothetical protein